MAEEIKAHITGVVFQVTAKVGDKVAAGDPVIVLESMKMEIPVEASRAGSPADLDILDEATVAPTLAALGERWVALERDQASYLDELRASDLERGVRFRLLSGKEYTQPLGLLLHHVTDHGTHHRSEIATMLTMVSGSPPGTGLARFVFLRSGQDRP